MSDGIKTIDYVLVWRDNDTSELKDMHMKRREIFSNNLEKEGLILEEDAVADIPLRYKKFDNAN